MCPASDPDVGPLPKEHQVSGKILDRNLIKKDTLVLNSW